MVKPGTMLMLMGAVLLVVGALVRFVPELFIWPEGHSKESRPALVPQCRNTDDSPMGVQRKELR